MNDSNFSFSAPQYYDFTSFNDEDPKEVELYFEVDHESNKGNKEDEIIYIEDDDNDQEFHSVLADDKDNELSYSHNKLRKSLSTGNILKKLWNSTKINDDIDDEASKERFNTINNLKETKNSIKSSSSTCLYKPINQSHRNTTSFASKEWLNKLAQPKYLSHNSVKSSRFVSMAEAVQKFQKGTPERFHSNRYNNKPHSASVSVDHNIPKGPTIPKSPALSTKSRARSANNIPNREQREIIEFQEAQKNKFTSHPVNKKIFKTPVLPSSVERKPITVPEPFRLSQAIKKEAPNIDQTDHVFHANPVPKGLFNTVSKPIIKKISKTQPKTPALLKRYNAQIKEKAERENALKGSNHSIRSNDDKKEECLDKNGKRCTEIRPFSFEERDRIMLKKKEEALQKVLEEEKKMREFHAHPVPKFIKEKKQISTESLPTQHVAKAVREVVAATTTAAVAPAPQFKARPAKVLLAKPFEPKKPTKVLKEIPNFELNTDKRAKERQQFDEKMKEKERLIAEHKMKMEEERIRLEEEKAADLRRVTTYKAQPIRKYKPVEPVPQKNLTRPISPKFRLAKSFEHSNNKENVTN